MCPKPHEIPAPIIWESPLQPNQKDMRNGASSFVQNIVVMSIQAGPMPASAKPAIEYQEERIV